MKYLRSNKKTITAFLLCLLASTILTSSINAQQENELELITPEQAKLDLNNTREDDNYISPSGIVVTPVYPRASGEEISSYEFYRGIHFYTTEILGFNDIPFHYLVSEDGEIFAGNKGGDERKIRIEGITGENVIIGYMTSKSAGRFTKKANSSLQELITDIANRNYIDPENVQITGINFLRNQATRTVTMESTEIFGNWKSNMSQIALQVALDYNPQPRTYTVEVLSVELPTEPVQPGSEVTVKLELQNTSRNGIYAGSNSELLLSRTGNAASSEFFLNNVWASVTQALVMPEGGVLLPNSTETFEVKMRAPLYQGEYSEIFQLETINGETVNAEPFEVKIKLAESEKQIIEIQNTETGFLRVRGEASSVGAEIGRVSAGERFLVEEDAGNGWLRITLGNGDTGWIANWYVNYI